MITERFGVNDYLFYLGTGVCHIDDIRYENFGGMGERQYFVMRSINDERSLIFVPTDAEKLTSYMFELLTADEIDTIIDRAEREELEWIEDNKERAARFNEYISTGDRSQILKIFRALYFYKLQAESDKKKLYATDERLLSAVRKIITEEFSFVLGIEPSEVALYIEKRVGDLA